MRNGICKSLIIVLSVISLAACAFDTIVSDEPISVSRIIASCESKDKTALMSDHTTIYWTPGDEINVFFSSYSLKYSSLCAAPEAVTVFAADKGYIFAGGEGEQAYVWAYYPYNPDNIYDGTSICSSIPVNQLATPGSFAKGVFPSMGRSLTNAISFYNICGGVTFSVEHEGVTRIVFRAAGGKAIAGKFKAGFDSEGRPEVKEIIEGSDSVVVFAPQDSVFKTNKSYYLSALPCQLPSGFTMTFETGSSVGNRAVSKAVEIKRSVFGNVGVADSGVEYKNILDEGVTVYGYVKCGTTPVRNVVVSDGVLCTTTNYEGQYQLKSKKKNGLVFISVPAYYKTGSNQTQPQFFKQLTAPADVAERHDFYLFEDPGQNQHTRYIFGDIHICDPEAEKEFGKFTNKINAELKAGLYKNPVGLTLGDMTWDWWWYHDDSGREYDYYYQIPEFLRSINKIEGLQVYYTVGNHDHDMKYAGEWWNSKAEYETTGEDWTCEIPYRKLQGPTCYSTNIGGVHYISMDDAITIDDGSGTKDGRGNKLGYTKADLEWLKNDLSYVDPAVPVVLSLHIPIHNEDGSRRTPDGFTLEQMFAPFKGRTGQLIVLSAHLHRIFNVESDTINGVNMTEWNTPSVCGNLWTSSPKGMNICTNGTPGGYRVIEFEGTKVLNSRYIPTEAPAGEFYPFRSYDRNKIYIPTSQYGFDTVSSDNYVYIYVWDWTSKWKIQVMEAGYGKLEPQRITEGLYDPLTIQAGVDGKTGKNPDLNRMTFRVQAHNPNSTLQIVVTDPYGHQAMETMLRPKNFSYEAYKSEIAAGYYYVPPGIDTNLEDYNIEIYEY